MTDRTPAPTYRQRFTGFGQFGVVLTVLAPIIWGIMMSIAANTERYDTPFSSAWFALPAFAAIVGPIMMLVGREYYDATEEIAEQARKLVAPPTEKPLA